MKVEEFLEAQQNRSSRLRATLERTADDPPKIKVTPWIPDMGCLCSQSFFVSFDVIADVTPTKDTHVCSGKMLLVAEVNFVSGAQIMLADVLRNAAQAPGNVTSEIMNLALATSDAHVARTRPLPMQQGQCQSHCDDDLFACYDTCQLGNEMADRDYACIALCDYDYDNCQYRCSERWDPGFPCC